MVRAAHLLFGFLLAAVPGTAQTAERVYSPGTNLEQSELAQLETATHTLEPQYWRAGHPIVRSAHTQVVAMYSFTDRHLAEEQAP